MLAEWVMSQKQHCTKKSYKCTIIYLVILEKKIFHPARFANPSKNTLHRSRRQLQKPKFVNPGNEEYTFFFERLPRYEMETKTTANQKGLPTVTNNSVVSLLGKSGDNASNFVKNEN